MFFVYLFSFVKKQKTIKRKLIFVFRFFVLVQQKTENDKTEVDFWFSFICFSSTKNKKTIKRKLIFVFRLFRLICAIKQKTIKRKLIEVFVFLFKFAHKMKNDKTEVESVFRLLS